MYKQYKTVCCDVDQYMTFLGLGRGTHLQAKELLLFCPESPDHWWANQITVVWEGGGDRSLFLILGLCYTTANQSAWTVQSWPCPLPIDCPVTFQLCLLIVQSQPGYLTVLVDNWPIPLRGGGVNLYQRKPCCLIASGSSFFLLSIYIYFVTMPLNISL